MAQRLGFESIQRLAVVMIFGLLALLTARAACRAAYINYDRANEFLVYAHGATGVKDLGKVMGVIKTRAAGRVDMSTVSARVRTMLTPE